MPLVSFEINFMLTWYYKCVLPKTTAQETIFKITDTKFYVPIVTSSTQDNAKLLQQLKSGFKEQLTGMNINQK